MQPTKRRLTDLWVVGREVTFDDGNGEPITIWLQKLNATEVATAQRRCDAERARRLAVKADPEGDGWQSIWSSVLDYGEDIERLVEFLVVEDRARAMRNEEARMAEEEEWSKDNYLQGLRDAWEGSDGVKGLKDVFAEEPENAEALRVHDELARFADKVDAAVNEVVAAASDGYRFRGIGACQQLMGERILDLQGNQAWLNELHACQLWMGVREQDDHKKQYFASRDEINYLSPEMTRRLRDEYATLEVDVTEGKGLPPRPTSSPSSEQSNEAETEASSGLVSVGA